MTRYRRFYSPEGEKAFGGRPKRPYLIIIVNVIILIFMWFYYQRLRFSSERTSLISSEGLEYTLSYTLVPKEDSILLSLRLRNISGRTLNLGDSPAIFYNEKSENRVYPESNINLPPGDDFYFRFVTVAKKYKYSVSYKGIFLSISNLNSGK